jgi:hypothetical protein
MGEARDEYHRLALPGLKARIEEDPADHALSLVLLDGRDNVCQLLTGEPDQLGRAIDALDRLVEVAGRLAGLLRIRRGDLVVLQMLAEPLERVDPPMNAGGL